MFLVFDLKKHTKLIKVFLAIIFIVCSLISIYFLFPLKHIEIIKKNAVKYNLEPSLVFAIIHAESKFQEQALSNKGASGLMQLTRPTAEWIAKEMKMENFEYGAVFNPEINIEFGCWYLNWLSKRYSQQAAIFAAYNAGSGNVNKWLKNPEYSKDGKTIEVIPFKETSDYVKRVNFNLKVYKILLNFGGTND